MAKKSEMQRNRSKNRIQVPKEGTLQSVGRMTGFEGYCRGLDEGKAEREIRLASNALLLVTTNILDNVLAVEGLPPKWQVVQLVNLFSQLSNRAGMSMDKFLVTLAYEYKATVKEHAPLLEFGTPGMINYDAVETAIRITGEIAEGIRALMKETDPERVNPDQLLILREAIARNGSDLTHEAFEAMRENAPRKGRSPDPANELLRQMKRQYTTEYGKQWVKMAHAIIRDLSALPERNAAQDNALSTLMSMDSTTQSNHLRLL